MNNNRYHQLRSRSASQVAEEQLGFQVEESQQQINSDILATKVSLSKAKVDLASTESAYPFNSKAVIDAELKVEGFQAGLERLEKIKQRLFDEPTDQAGNDQSQDSAK